MYKHSKMRAQKFNYAYPTPETGVFSYLCRPRRLRLSAAVEPSRGRAHLCKTVHGCPLVHTTYARLAT